MLVDHIGALFFPDLVWLRLIGRLSFPIFAFLLAGGFIYTSNIYKYLGRLFIFALITQPFFYLAFPGNTLNIFATLFLGLVAILFYDKIKNRYLAWLAVLLVAIVGELIKVDYGLYGVLFPLSFYLFIKQKSFSRLIIFQIILNLIFILKFYIFIQLNLFVFTYQLFIQFFSLFSIWLIKYYNGQRGRRFKYAFYSFYPLHILVLVLLKYFL